MGVYKLSGAGGLLTPRVNYTSMLAGNEAFELSSYQLISTTILEAAAPSVTFSNLGQYSSTYKHLQIRYASRGTNAESSNNLAFRLNGDSGNNYTYHVLEAGYSGSTVISGGATSQAKAIIGVSAGSATTANVFGAGVIDILDPFSTTKNKTLRSLSGNHSNDPVIGGARSALWMSTASVTSIILDHWITSNLVAGSRFSLYGIKG